MTAKATATTTTTALIQTIDNDKIKWLMTIYERSDRHLTISSTHFLVVLRCAVLLPRLFWLCLLFGYEYETTIRWSYSYEYQMSVIVCSGTRLGSMELNRVSICLCAISQSSCFVWIVLVFVWCRYHILFRAIVVWLLYSMFSVLFVCTPIINLFFFMYLWQQWNERLYVCFIFFLLRSVSLWNLLKYHAHDQI